MGSLFIAPFIATWSAMRVMLKIIGFVVILLLVMAFLFAAVGLFLATVYAMMKTEWLFMVIAAGMAYIAAVFAVLMGRALDWYLELVTDY